jgi:5-dehydro-2-deoxygluconokinase
MTDRFDLITMGRVGVDLYPEQIGVHLADVRTFAKSLGGSATNVAVAAARLGARSAVITKVGDDPFGPYVRQALTGFGVDPRWVGTDPDPWLRTPVVFCEIFPPDHFPILFYRQPKAPDMNLTPDDLDLGAVAAARLFWTTGTGLSDEPSRGTTLAALAARPRTRGSGGLKSEAPTMASSDPSQPSGRPPVKQDAVTVHDLDHRPSLWRDEEAAGPLARQALAHATVAVGNLSEVAVAVGPRGPHDAAKALLDLGVDFAVVKLGPQGVLGVTRDATVQVPPVPVEVVCGLGAGDAFGGALCHGLLSGWDPERTLRFANAAGAIVASRLACADAMPTVSEVEGALR